MNDPIKVSDGSQPIKIILFSVMALGTIWFGNQIMGQLDTIIQNQQTTINAINKGIIPNLK